jgi:hypothetical protein
MNYREKQDKIRALTSDIETVSGQLHRLFFTPTITSAKIEAGVISNNSFTGSLSIGSTLNTDADKVIKDLQYSLTQLQAITKELTKETVDNA